MINIDKRNVIQRLVIPLVVVVLNPFRDRRLQAPGKVAVFELDLFFIEQYQAQSCPGFENATARLACDPLPELAAIPSNHLNVTGGVV